MGRFQHRAKLVEKTGSHNPRKISMNIKVNRSNIMSSSLSEKFLNAALKEESAQHNHQQANAQEEPVKIWIVTQYESRKDPAVIVGVFFSKTAADEIRAQVSTVCSVSRVRS